jgi:hypothetical protein
MVEVTEQKVVFATGKRADGSLMLVVGIPKGAWDYMREGKTNHFDLAKAGVPLSLMMFGGESHADVMKTVNEAMSMAGKAYDDQRRTDFSIDGLGDKPG